MEFQKVIGDRKVKKLIGDRCCGFPEGYRRSPLKLIGDLVGYVYEMFGTDSDQNLILCSILEKFTVLNILLK